MCKIQGHYLKKNIYDRCKAVYSARTYMTGRKSSKMTYREENIKNGQKYCFKIGIYRFIF